MKRTLAFLCAVVLFCTTALSGCGVLTKAVREQAVTEAQVFGTGDIGKINKLIFGDADIKTEDDPLQELTSLSAGEGVGINVLGPLVKMCEVTVVDTSFSTVSYVVISPDMSGFFDKKYEEIKTSDNETITQTIIDYASSADEVTAEVEIEYSKEDKVVYINYADRAFTDAITGGLVSQYADKYKEKHDKELADLMKNPVGDALSYECSDSDGKYAYKIPEILINRGSVADINKEIWDTYNQKVEETKNNIAKKVSVVVTAISYEWYLNDTALSLIIKHSAPNDYEGYSLYNVDISSGEKLSNEQIVALAGFSDDDYKDTAKKALESKHWDLYYDGIYTDLTNVSGINSANECLNKTRSEKNISKCRPYLNDKGELCIIADIYSVAGADKYSYPINLETFKLSDHYGEKIEPKADSATYSIQRRDHSIYDSASGLPLIMNYYDQVVLDGNSAETNSINALIKADYHKQIPDRSGNKYKNELNYPLLTTEYPFRDIYEAKVTNNSDGIFSICIAQHWYMGGVSNRNYHGLTYDLNTGKELSLTELTGESASSLNSKLKKIVWNQIITGGFVFPEAYDTLNDYSIDEYLYYVENGQLVLTFPTYTFAAGAAGPTTVYTGIQVN